MQKLQRLYRATMALPWIIRFGLMLVVVILLALLLPKPAQAEDRIARHGGDEVVITDGPCNIAAVLARLEPKEREQFRRAEATFNGKRFFACWREAAGVAYLVYDDGDQGLVPMRAFRVIPTI